MCSARCLLVCLLASAMCGLAAGANILTMSFIASRSHHIWEKTIAIALRDRGHNITYVTPFKDKNEDNFTVIYLEDVNEILHADYNISDIALIDPWETVTFTYEWFAITCELSAKTEGIRQLMDLVASGIKFDLVLFDTTAGQCFYPFIEKLGSPPTIATSPFGIQYYHKPAFGISYDASFLPLYMMTYTTEMTFTQRLNNYVYSLLSQFWHQYVYIPRMWKVAQELFGPGISPLEDIEHHFSFLLANYDPNFDYPKSLPPTVIPVGGLHVNRQSVLPKNLETILDNAKDGFILFSLGTNLRSDKLDAAIRDALLKAFAQLKETVIWKFESEIENLPKNVIVRSWLPQNVLLAHPKIKLFITHGGALSTQEAMYHGVPVLGIPFFCDQHVNMYKITNAKRGLTLYFSDLTSESVLKAIKEVLNNPIYKKNMLEVSARYRDQPEDALQRAVFWVEYALRHNGAHHLHVKSRDIPAYKLYYLDIWALIISIAALVCIILAKIWALVFQKTRKSKLKTN